MLISSESETVESVALTTDTVMSSPDSGAPVTTSMAERVIVPDSPGARVSVNLSTLIEKKSLTWLLLISATKV